MPFDAVYPKITDKEFDKILKRVVKENVDTLTSIPEVYDAVSEYYNNKVLEIWVTEKIDSGDVEHCDECCDYFFKKDLIEYNGELLCEKCYQHFKNDGD